MSAKNVNYRKKKLNRHPETKKYNIQIIQIKIE